MYIPRCIWQVVYYIPIIFWDMGIDIQKWEILEIHIYNKYVEYKLKSKDKYYLSRELFPNERKTKERIKELIQNRFELQFNN